MVKRAGSIRLMAATIILIWVAAISFAGTVFAGAVADGIAMCRADLSRAELDRYYREREQQLVKDTRGYLNRSGFDNSGVMLTRVVDGSGSRLYTVTVHHREIDRMEEAEREVLAQELAAFAFEDDSSTFCYKFLFTD